MEHSKKEKESALSKLDYCSSNQDLCMADIEPNWLWEATIVELQDQVDEGLELKHSEIEFLLQLDTDILDENIGRAEQFRRDWDRD